MDFKKAVEIDNENRKGREGKKYNCPVCGTTFIKLKTRRFCSRKCANIFNEHKTNTIVTNQNIDTFRKKRIFIKENFKEISSKIEKSRLKKKGDIVECPYCGNYFTKKNSIHFFCCEGSAMVYGRIKLDKSHKVVKTKKTNEYYYEEVNNKASHLISNNSTPYEIIQAYLKIRGLNDNIKDMLGRDIFDILSGKQTPGESFYWRCRNILFMNTKIIKESFERGIYV